VTLRLLSYNVCRGGAGREQPIISVIASCAPDIVILQEATRPEVVERIARGAGMAQWASRAGESLGFMARMPVARHQRHRPRFSRHAFLEIVPGGSGADVFGLHLSAVFAAWTERRRLFELRALLRSIESHESGFHCLAGDFNTLAPGDLLDFSKLPARLRALVWLSGGKVRWRTIQLVLDEGYVDAFRRLHPGDPGLTFPTWDPHVRLDYVFVPKAYADRVKSCDVVRHPDTRAASDHFPILAELDA
jgi:exodeoxyribonuclease III